MRTYTQLTQEQRYQIYALLKMDLTQTEIVKLIGVHESTISRELRRNRGLRGYRPKQAHQLAMSRRGNSKPCIDNTTWALIKSLVHQD
jgi:IS30 family transposase